MNLRKLNPSPTSLSPNQVTTCDFRLSTFVLEDEANPDDPDAYWDRLGSSVIEHTDESNGTAKSTSGPMRIAENYDIAIASTPGSRWDQDGICELHR